MLFVAGSATSMVRLRALRTRFLILRRHQVSIPWWEQMVPKSDHVMPSLEKHIWVAFVADKANVTT